jgi:hypothetical protein
MAIIYRTAGPWGAGKGANLVAGEVDGNFFDVDGRLSTVEGNIPDAANGIAYFAVDGNLFYVHMTDGTIQGPFALPQIAWNFRGEWQPSTLYYMNDVFTSNGSTYMVLINHTSGSVFDPGANDGSGHEYYGLLLTNPAVTLPSGGVTGQILTKVDDTDYNTTWTTPAIFPAQQLREAPDPTYILTFNDIASYVRCVNAAGCAITIQPDSTLNFPLGVEISFRQCTASAVVLAAASGVTFNAIGGLTTQTNRQGAVITAKKIGDNVWDVFGLLS